MAVLNRILHAPHSGDDALHGPSLAARRYHGQMRGENQCDVWFENPPTENTTVPEHHPLPMQLDARHHSSTGFG